MNLSFVGVGVRLDLVNRFRLISLVFEEEIFYGLAKGGEQDIGLISEFNVFVAEILAPEDVEHYQTVLQQQRTVLKDKYGISDLEHVGLDRVFKEIEFGFR